MKDSWITKAIEKQQRDVKDIPRYILDAYAGTSGSKSTVKTQDRKR
jgi:hypothetical protein